MIEENISILGAIDDLRAKLDTLERLTSQVDLSVDEHDFVVYHIENAVNSIENAIQY